MTPSTLDILADERIIFSYHMTMDEALFTVSQQVLEFSAKGTGCHLKVVEQILFIDGVDHLEDRIAGTQGMLDNLAAYLVHASGECEMIAMIVILVLAALVTFLIVVVAKPNNFRLQRSATIKAAPDVIYAHIADFTGGGLVAMGAAGPQYDAQLQRRQ